MKHGLATVVVIMILKDTTTLQRFNYYLYFICAWNITIVEINSGFHLYWIVKSAFVLLLVVLFLVLRFVSCLHHCSKLGTLTRSQISLRECGIWS